jgi:2-methylcitrate dehydratase PrpD
MPTGDTDSTGNLSPALAAHVAGVRFGQLSQATVHASKRALLDAVGVMYAASGLAREARPFIELAKAQKGAPESTILGTGARVPAAMAALANGAMAHALDYEDAFDAAPVHPDASLVPAVLALSQSRAPIGGRQLIAAIATGCDFACRLALCLRQPLEAGGWYPPPILAAYGAVAGAANLLQLSPAQVTSAWSLLLLQNSCVGEIKYDADTVIRAVREAFPAQAAVTSTLLAEAGIQGFRAPFEGRAGFFALFAGGHYEPRELPGGLGLRNLVEQLSFKPWPSCRGTHAAIEAALWMREQPGFDASLVEAVTVQGSAVQAMLAEPLQRKRAPSTAIDAKFSLPFTIAVALLKGKVTLESFGDSALCDVEVRAMARRIVFVEHAQPGAGGATAAGLHLQQRDGRFFERWIADPGGSPSRPLPDEALVDKFVDCVGRAQKALAPQAARTMAARILALEDEPDAGAVFG